MGEIGPSSVDITFSRGLRRCHLSLLHDRIPIFLGFLVVNK